MKIRNAIDQLTRIVCPPDIVEPAGEMVRLLSTKEPKIEIDGSGQFSDEPGSINLTIVHKPEQKQLPQDFPDQRPGQFIWIKIRPGAAIWIISSDRYYLYAAFRDLIETHGDDPVASWESGKLIEPAFISHRVSYDYFLTQEGRICQGLNRKDYVKQLASGGFTHIEVNGLAYPAPLETGPKGEAYPMFYTYCPALDQFVSSQLNEGLYPSDYLANNLRFLKENARLARQFGLVPGLLSFEPRSVPEAFFDRYPMLRGARVDHPFRSFKPRYNMTITHPLVRAHYAEMMQKLMHEVPELGFITIWTNDSGAGFEHTKSLYVGRNGGAYLIREWKNDREIARLAGENALRFFNTLREAAAEVNPDFRVITRMESFYGEHEIILNGLGNGLDIETASLVQRGWQMPYHHPKYPGQKDINAGSVYQREIDPKEKKILTELNTKKVNTYFYFGYGPQVMFAPLLGIPYPILTWKRLQQLRSNGIRHLAHLGGTAPPDQVPYNINHLMVRTFQFNPDTEPESFLHRYAARQAGKTMAPRLLKAWKLTEEAILGFPVITSLYATIGFTWYRLWARPLVPDIEKIDPEERRYYADFMCTTPHNPNNVDLSRDVLFKLTTPEKCSEWIPLMDARVFPPLDEAISLLAEATSGICYDQRIRLQALRCWMMTQRNVASWISTVYGYLQTKDPTEKQQFQSALKDTIHGEIENSRDLISLFDSSITFMALTDQGETELVYGTNLKELLVKRIRLMEDHLNDKPFIDMNYTERKAGETIQ